MEEDRRGKLERLRERGIEPFPHEFPGVGPIGAVHGAHGDLEAGQETDAAYRIAGRLTARRGHGKAAFLDVVDRSGRMQVHARQDVLGEESFEDLVSLDLIANEEARELFILRSRVIASVRRWLDDRGFLEVETPVLQPLYGGGLSRPLTTHHNALDRDLYLRIAPQLYLKRVIVGGLERVYELGKDFRNEGLSPKHNPEFTMLEWYEAYADYTDMAAELEELVAFVAGEVGYDGTIDFS